MKFDSHQLAAEIKRRAREMGFDLVGIAPASPSVFRDYLRRWLDEGQAGTMNYLASRFEERTNPAAYFPDSKSIICVGMNYHVRLDQATESLPGKVARYALGDDYHELIKDRLHLLADWLQAQCDCQTRCSVDTAPVMEKELAARAGIGWMGKNTCVINEDIGSWLLLGEILINAELPFDQPATDRCGTCRRCLDACPTGAITAPYQLDPRKCISYLTIEHRGDIDAQLKSQIGDWLYGCDVCQDVCPWNSKAIESIEPALQPRFTAGALRSDEVLQWDQDQYAKTLKRSAMKRVKLPQLQRNAKIVMDNRSETK